MMFLFFFFSSRRRHTRFDCDWSSDVCSSDLTPDAERGTIVKAFVVLKPGVVGDVALIKMLQDFVKQSIAPYKYPRAIEFCDALPRAGTGKIQRYRLRQQEHGGKIGRASCRERV